MDPRQNGGNLQGKKCLKNVNGLELRPLAPFHVVFHVNKEEQGRLNVLYDDKYPGNTAPSAKQKQNFNDTTL